MTLKTIGLLYFDVDFQEHQTTFLYHCNVILWTNSLLTFFLYSGTKYCTRFGATYNAKLIDGSNPEDECCKILKGKVIYPKYYTN